MVLTAVMLSGVLSADFGHAAVIEPKVSTAKSLAHYMMGQVYDFLGLTKRAALEYQQAAQYDGSVYLIHLRLGAAFARLNMLDEAEQELKFVGELKEDELQSRYLLALIYATENEHEKAAREYEYILTRFSAADPQNTEIHAYLGQLYFAQRKYDQAIAQFENLLKLEPANTDVMYLLGSLYLEEARTGDAIRILEGSLKLAPDHDGSLNTLAYAYALEEIKLDEALDMIRRALDMKPNNGAYLDTLGWIYFKKGMFEEALASLLEAEKVLKDPVIYDHLGDVYFKQDQVEQAIAYWQKSLSLDPAQEEVDQKIRTAQSLRAQGKTDTP